MTVEGGATVTAAGPGGRPIAQPRPGPPSLPGIPPPLYRRFEGFELVGQGGMGAVYRARDLQLGRTVAIKLLFGHDPRGGLLQEARSQARLRHPHVCEVFEAGVADQVPFVVMRYVDGGPLGRLRAEMTLGEKVRVIREIALALHAAHRIGLVHRDVKPGNILVERADDGTWKPFIADFGIARDLTDAAAAMTAAVQGTPAFMAPEQAAGKSASIDRRTDVYGLGASLYEILAGQPPFTAPTVPELLRMVVDSPPAPLRTVEAAVPVDLEAIVMKCLAKDPDGRYDSAKALGEDLQSFLEGDPVEARRPSWGARLWLRARKHKGKVAVAGAALAAALSFAGVRIRDGRVADERAELSRELGGSVREMELFLWGAHAMPLHDVERERGAVRARLRDIEARMAAAGEIAAGPGHDALGRGHLALRDARTALAHLQRAWATGYRAPGLEYAMGLARIELYREALEKASRIPRASDKAAFVAEIEREHRAPAIEHLRAALAQGVESPDYAHGLIALHEGRLEEALAHAQKAFEAAPWLHEAKKLEGDVLFAMGSRTGHDRAFDHARTTASFERAAAAYREAAEHARSDPSIHEQECALWIQVMNAAAEHGDSMRPGFERAKAACERAIAASPQSPSSRLKLAWAHNCFAFWVAAGVHAGESPGQALAEAVARVEEARKASLDDAFAGYLVGAVHRSKALYEGAVGLDDGASLDRAVAGYESALAVDPGFLWALNELCGSLALRGGREARLGREPAATFREALSRCGRALELDPDFLFPRANTIFVHMIDAERLAATGRSPLAAVEQGLAAAELAAARHPSWRWLPYWRARLHRVAVEYAFAKGEDPAAALARAEAPLAQLAAQRASFADAGAAEGEVLTVKAEALVARLEGGAAASEVEPALLSALAGARTALGAAQAEMPWAVELAVWLTRAALAELRYRTALGRATEAHGGAVLAPLAPFLEGPRADPLLYETAAGAREARAERLRRSGQDDSAEITAGIGLAERAVEVGPGRAGGHAVLGRLWLSRARSARDPAQRKELARRAAEALGAAMRGNALLGRTHADLLSEASLLAGG
jgi:tetratricopeptide (TPR) repeat protein/predicted Ser/Thr protein kinase